MSAPLQQHFQFPASANQPSYRSCASTEAAANTLLNLHNSNNNSSHNRTPSVPSHHRHSRTPSAQEAAAGIKVYQLQLYQQQQAIEQHQARLSAQHSRNPSSFQQQYQDQNQPQQHNQQYHHERHSSTIRNPSPQRGQTPRMQGNGSGVHANSVTSSMAPPPAPDALSTASIHETSSYMLDFSLLAEAARRAQVALMVDEMNNISL